MGSYTLDDILSSVSDVLVYWTAVHEQLSNGHNLDDAKQQFTELLPDTLVMSRAADVHGRENPAHLSIAKGATYIFSSVSSSMGVVIGSPSGSHLDIGTLVLPQELAEVVQVSGIRAYLRAQARLAGVSDADLGPESHQITQPVPTGISREVELKDVITLAADVVVFWSEEYDQLLLHGMGVMNPEHTTLYTDFLPTLLAAARSADIYRREHPETDKLAGSVEYIASAVAASMQLVLTTPRDGELNKGALVTPRELEDSMSDSGMLAYMENN